MKLKEYNITIHVCLCNVLNWMYRLEFDVSDSCYVEVENGALLRNVMWSWKMILEGHGKAWKIMEIFRC